jgi:hypothetical protein
MAGKKSRLEMQRSSKMFWLRKLQEMKREEETGAQDEFVTIFIFYMRVLA